MNNINKHNYEAYLLDFSEGNLTDELQMELELFLIQHPYLNIDFTELSFVSLNDGPVLFSDKNNLKKSSTDLVSEHQFISYIENQLTINERISLEKSCTLNPILSKELALFKNTLIEADKSIVYTNKYKLKRKPKIIWLNFLNSSKYTAAACILFLIGLVVLWPKAHNTFNKTQLALKQNDQTQTKTIVIKNNKIALKAKNLTTSIIPITHTKLSRNNTILKQNNNKFLQNDTLNQITKNNNTITEIQKTETLLTQKSPTEIKQKTQTIVQVITEDEEDEIVTLNNYKKKKGIWGTASRLLKNLNHFGVKYVNGEEEATGKKNSYALTLGDVNITHKADNL